MAFMQYSILWALLLLANFRLKACTKMEMEFYILHNNDMHSRFEQINDAGGVCSKKEAKANECLGGFARLAHVVRENRFKSAHNGIPFFYLNAGDTFSGTRYYQAFKEQIVIDFLNLLDPDAICLGNHEFYGQEGSLENFLNSVEFPVVVCNLNVDNDPILKNTTSLSKSTILHTTNGSIGVIGYITPHATARAKTYNIKFEDEIVAINAEAKKLKMTGVEKIIALGHSGIQKDLQIAKNCPDIDIVIGGHSHTFLSNVKPAKQVDDSSEESVRGPYPIFVSQLSGKRVPVVQAFAYTKYYGLFHVKFNENGNLTLFEGSPELLGPEIEQDQDFIDLLASYSNKIERLFPLLKEKETVYQQTIATSASGMKRSLVVFLTCFLLANV